MVEQKILADILSSHTNKNTMKPKLLIQAVLSNELSALHGPQRSLNSCKITGDVIQISLRGVPAGTEMLACASSLSRP